MALSVHTACRYELRGKRRGPQLDNDSCDLASQCSAQHSLTEAHASGYLRILCASTKWGHGLALTGAFVDAETGVELLPSCMVTVPLREY